MAAGQVEPARMITSGFLGIPLGCCGRAKSESDHATKATRPHVPHGRPTGWGSTRPGPPRERAPGQPARGPEQPVRRASQGPASRPEEAGSLGRRPEGPQRESGSPLLEAVPPGAEGGYRDDPEWDRLRRGLRRPPLVCLRAPRPDPLPGAPRVRARPSRRAFCRRETQPEAQDWGP